MTKTPLLTAAVLAALAVSGAAQVLESQAGAAAADQRLSVQGLPTTYAKSIVCAKPPKDAGLPDGLKFYTHLDGKRVSKLPVDDTASRLDDYRRSYVDGGRWHYDAWSCDTQDYWFSVPVCDLVRGSAAETNRPVKVHARVETRGQVDWEGDLDCVASW